MQATENPGTEIVLPFSHVTLVSLTRRHNIPLYDKTPPAPEPLHLSYSEFHGLNGQLDKKSEIVRNYQGDNWRISGIVYTINIGKANYTTVITLREFREKGSPERLPMRSVE